MKEDGAFSLDSGVTADLVWSRRLTHRNSMLGLMGPPRVAPFPAQARFTFGDGRVGDVRHSADIAAGIAGAEDNFAAFASDADIPAFFRKGALGSLGGRPDFSRDALAVG